MGSLWVVHFILFGQRSHLFLRKNTPDFVVKSSTTAGAYKQQLSDGVPVNVTSMWVRYNGCIIRFGGEWIGALRCLARNQGTKLILWCSCDKKFGMEILALESCAIWSPWGWPGRWCQWKISFSSLFWFVNTKGAICATASHKERPLVSMFLCCFEDDDIARIFESGACLTGRRLFVATMDSTTLSKRLFWMRQRLMCLYCSLLLL